ncbi:MAG: Wzz/FepE/Etk N-terminal domain-containing protein [Bacteroidetes bacterium]|nr:Wzz/FepE/Etk N-terminal domain-containing protein [Bacteroidota bacterium]
MTENNQEIKDFNSTNFFIFLWNWRKTLIIVIIAAAVVSAAASFLITPKFKSTVVMFPTSTNSISKALLDENNTTKADILDFGDEEQAEQLLQILNSSKIRDRVIQRFNLAEHYGISPDSKYKNTYLIQEYNDNISFKRTEFMAVEINVLDKDPQMAADIANTISNLLDSTKNAMQKERAKRGFEIVKSNYESLQNEIKLLDDSLKYIRQKGINDYETQSEMINQELAIQIGKSNAKGIKSLQDKLDTLAKYGGLYVTLRTNVLYKTEQFNKIKAKFDAAKVDAEEYIPQKFTVDNAFKAEKKTTPVRWLIVVVSSFSAFMLSILVLIFIENVYKKGILKK